MLLSPLVLLLLFVSLCCCCLLQRQCCCFLLLLLLLAANRHRVPDGKICCWFIESEPSLFFLFKDDFFLMHPLAVLLHLRPRFACILGNYRHARSQGGRQPAAARPPLYNILFYFPSENVQRDFRRPPRTSDIFTPQGGGGGTGSFPTALRI